MLVLMVSNDDDCFGIGNHRERIMAKKKTGVGEVASTVSEIRHARLELPDEDYERLKR